MGDNMEFISPEQDFEKRVIDEQQYWYGNLYEYDWDEYTLTEHFNLKKIIGYALFGPPTQVPVNSDNDNDALGYTKNECEQILKIYELIKIHNYVEKPNVIHMRVIFVICILKESELNKGKYLRYLTYSWKKAEDRKNAEAERQRNRIIRMPLFVLKKCHSKFDPSSPDLCNIFIDNEGRVYKSWKLFLEDNKLPKCVMYCPLNGRYSGEVVFINADGADGETKVNLEIHESPACGLGQKALNVADTTGTVTSLGATGILVAGVIPGITVAPVALIGAGVTCAAVGVYSVGRSIAQLVDRGIHEQSINLSDPEARNCWLNTVAGTVSTVGGAASGLLTRAISNGKVIGDGARLAFNVTQIAALTTSGVALANSGYNIIVKMVEDKEVSALDIFQFASSVLFLSKSAVSFKTASKIISETQSSILQEYETSLRSNRHRKIFNKALKETQRMLGKEKGTAEAISSIKNIQDKDNFFAGLARRNKEFNEKNIKFTLTADGKASLNSVHTIDPSEFASLGISERNGILSNLTPQQPANPTTALATTRTTVDNWFSGKMSTETQIRLGHATLQIVTKLLTSDFTIETISSILYDLEQRAINYVLSIYVELYSKLEDWIFDRLKVLFPLVDVQVAVLQFIKTVLLKITSEMQIALVDFLKMVVDPNDGKIYDSFLVSLIVRLKNWIESFKSRNQPAQPFITTEKKRTECSVCKGHFWFV